MNTITLSLICSANTPRETVVNIIAMLPIFAAVNEYNHFMLNHNSSSSYTSGNGINESNYSLININCNN